MMIHPLSRQAHRPAAGLSFLEGLALAPARVHEFCGPARRSLALIVARATRGPVFWIGPQWGRDRLHGAGVSRMIDPGRLTFVHPHRAEDILWSMEECLRPGCVPLVVCDCPGIPGLTPVRRLHLAAQNAARTGAPPPLGLLLIAANGGAPGVESRWHMAPAHEVRRTGWRLERRRDRMMPPKAWYLEERAGDYFLGEPPGGVS